jgi:general secretion pathway protein G
MSLQNRKRSQRGFTLIELLIVMSIIGILASIVAPNYQRNLIKAREAVLMEDLHQMRRAIDAYFADNIKYPESLEDLVDSKYLRDIPRDPFTKETDTWEEVAPTPSLEGEFAEGGLEDVHSGSDLVGLNGIPYRDW